MSIISYTLEHHFKLYNNDTGSYLTVGPDKDGLGLIEIVDTENELCSILLHAEQAKLLIDALTILIPEIKKDE